jgi:hypothetical protein
MFVLNFNRNVEEETRTNTSHRSGTSNIQPFVEFLLNWLRNIFNLLWNFYWIG